MVYDRGIATRNLEIYEREMRKDVQTALVEQRHTTICEMAQLRYHTLQEIGDVVGLTRERVRQVLQINGIKRPKRPKTQYTCPDCGVEVSQQGNRCVPCKGIVQRRPHMARIVNMKMRRPITFKVCPGPHFPHSNGTNGKTCGTAMHLHNYWAKKLGTTYRTAHVNGSLLVFRTS